VFTNEELESLEAVLAEQRDNPTLDLLFEGVDVSSALAVLLHVLDDLLHEFLDVLLKKSGD
jgi:hypothetical protein